MVQTVGPVIIPSHRDDNSYFDVVIKFNKISIYLK